jgi:hypothetical protein
MPLRALIYIGRVYEKIINRRSIYRSTLITIPTPEFHVLYNGAKDYPDEVTLRLSDAFKRVDIPEVRKLPMLDLAVSVLNINVGHNEKILEKCEILRGYAAFIGQVRDNQKAGLSLQDAITAAIDFCVTNDILVEYLENNGSEVHNMIFTEFNLEEAKEVWIEEGIEKGMKKGMEKGMEKGIDATLLVINALMIETPLDEIAAKHHMSVEQISRIRSTLSPGGLHH